jgi:hypothetical protein
MLMLCGMTTDDNVREDRRSGKREKRGNEARVVWCGGRRCATVGGCPFLCVFLSSFCVFRH